MSNCAEQKPFNTYSYSIPSYKSVAKKQVDTNIKVCKKIYIYLYIHCVGLDIWLDLIYSVGEIF